MQNLQKNVMIFYFLEFLYLYLYFFLQKNAKKKDMLINHKISFKKIKHGDLKKNTIYPTLCKTVIAKNAKKKDIFNMLRISMYCT